MSESFDFREFQLEARRKAFEDTKFEFNFRTFYIDKTTSTAPKIRPGRWEAWAGFKTGYFLEHFAFGATGYAVTPLYAPEDRDGTLLLEPGQDEFAVLGEIFAEIRIVDDLLSPSDARASIRLSSTATIPDDAEYL